MGDLSRRADVKACMKFSFSDIYSVMQEQHVVELNSTIRAEMARHRLTQDDLAVLLGLSRGSVSARLRGATGWKLSELPVIARALGCRLTMTVDGGASIAQAAEAAVAS